MTSIKDLPKFCEPKTAVSNVLCYALLLFCSLLTSCEPAPPSTKTVDPNKISIVPPSGTHTGNIEGNIKGCGFNNVNGRETITLYEPGLREIEQINSILKYTGLPSNFSVYSASIENALATQLNGERLILYDPKLLSMTDKSSGSGSYWSSMSILAHEIGHHLSGHVIGKGDSRIREELEADKFSGFVLYKMGASLEEAQKAINLLASEETSSTHPGKRYRIRAIKEGWEDANSAQFNAAIPPAPEDIVSFESGVSEFLTQDLIDAKSYNDLLKKSGYGSWTSPKVEGIVISEDNNYYTILITKGGGKDGPKKDEKLIVSLHDPNHAYNPQGRAQISWLYSILVPGRRIEFAYCEEGTAPSRYFAYIKYLPAKR